MVKSKKSDFKIGKSNKDRCSKCDTVLKNIPYIVKKIDGEDKKICYKCHVNTFKGMDNFKGGNGGLY